MWTLITRRAGFVGSHLAERHVERGEEVSIRDDFSTGHLDNLRRFADQPHLKMHNLDAILQSGIAYERSEYERRTTAIEVAETR